MAKALDEQGDPDGEDQSDKSQGRPDHGGLGHSVPPFAARGQPCWIIAASDRDSKVIYSVVSPSQWSLSWSRFGLLLGLVDDAVAMLGRAVDRVEPERLVAGVDHVVAGAGRDDHGEIVLDPVGDAVDPDLALAFLDPEELVAVLVHLLADVAAGRQRHQHQLEVACPV